MRPPRLPYLLAFIFVLVAGSGWAAYQVATFFRSQVLATTPRATRTRAPKKAAPMIDESPATAGKPLQALLDGLDFNQEGYAFGTFDRVLPARLRKGEYEALDRYAEGLMSTRARFPGGSWRIARMMDVLIPCPGGENQPGSAWTQHLGHFESWRKARPDSATAPVMEAGAWIEYAWDARGTGFANTVSRPEWRDFEDRLEKAKSILDAVPSGRRSLLWHRMTLRLALGQGWERVDYDRAFDAAVALEPEYQGFYQAKANYLLPRWHGEEGEWQRFAAERADRLGGEKGDSLYYFILESQWSTFKDASFFEDPQVSWDRMKRGFHASEKLYGVCPEYPNELCDVCRVAGDRQEGKLLLDRLGDHWSLYYWGNRKNFENYRDWVLRQGRYAGDRDGTPSR